MKNINKVINCIFLCSLLFINSKILEAQKKIARIKEIQRIEYESSCDYLYELKNKGIKSKRVDYITDKAIKKIFLVNDLYRQSVEIIVNKINETNRLYSFLIGYDKKGMITGASFIFFKNVKESYRIDFCFCKNSLIKSSGTKFGEFASWNSYDARIREFDFEKIRSLNCYIYREYSDNYKVIKGVSIDEDVEKYNKLLNDYKNK